MQNARSEALRLLITRGLVECVPGECDKNICQHPPHCQWNDVVYKIYEIERGLENELD